MENLKKELDELTSKGLKRSLRSRRGELINYSSNDYLGLSQHPLVVKAAKEALDQFGTGGTASRLLAGTVAPHTQLEQALAKFLKKEVALVFSSGYHANTGILPALMSAQDVIFFDRLSHASLIDGVRLSGAAFSAFDHNDMADLEKRLKKLRAKGRRAVIITEGIFSMDGDRPDLPRIVRLAREFDAWVYLDEAHSIGVIGENGSGLAAEENLLDQIDIHVGTLSKTLGSQGGFVAGSKVLIEYLISRCRSLAYTTALAPSLAASALAALELFPKMEKERRALLSASNGIRVALENMGYQCGTSRSPIIPILTGSVPATKALSDYLLSQGFFVPSIRPPTVPVNEGRVRLSVSLPVLDTQEKLLKVFEGGKVGAAR